MDEQVRRPAGPGRWLAWVVAALLVGGIVSVGAVSARDDAADEASSTTISAPADVTTSSTIAPPETVAPSTTAEVTATVAARPVRTTTTTIRRATTTARPPQATTTPRATTPTTAGVHGGTKTTVTVANDYAYEVTLSLSGRTFVLAPGQQQGPFEHIIEPNGNDSVEIRLVALPECGIGDADRIFPGAGSWRLAVVAGPRSCVGTGGTSFAGPIFRVTPA